jgi:hypothetical protein
MATVGLNCFDTLDCLGLALHLVDGLEFIDGVFGLGQALVDAVPPRFNLLLLMHLRVNLDAVRTKRFQTVELYAKVGDLLPRMLQTLQSRTVGRGLHIVIFNYRINI